MFKRLTLLAAAAAFFVTATPAKAQEPPDLHRHGTGTAWYERHPLAPKHAAKPRAHRQEVRRHPGPGTTVKPAPITATDKNNIFHRFAKSQETSRDCLTADTAAALNNLESAFGKVKIVSTCVTKSIAGTRTVSFHSFGRAVDFEPPSGQKANMVRWLHENEKVFVMTYSDMSHIHFNTGQRGLALARNSHTGGRHYARRHQHRYVRHHRYAAR